MKPPHASSWRLSLSEFALTVSTSRTPSGASSERSIVRSSSGRGRWARTDHIVMTSKPPAAISGIVRGRAVVGVRAAGLAARRLDRIRREVDAVGSRTRARGRHRGTGRCRSRSRAAVGRRRREQPRRTAPSSPRSGGSASSCTCPRGTSAYLPGAVEVAEPLGPDAGVPVRAARSGRSGRRGSPSAAACAGDRTRATAAGAAARRRARSPIGTSMSAPRRDGSATAAECSCGDSVRARRIRAAQRHSSRRAAPGRTRCHADLGGRTRRASRRRRRRIGAARRIRHMSRMSAA